MKDVTPTPAPSVRQADALPNDSILPKKRDLSPTPGNGAINPMGEQHVADHETQPSMSNPNTQRTEGALRVQLVHPNAVLPRRGSPLSAGFDLAACEQIVVPARGRAVVKTGLRIAVAEGYYGRVAPRSGLAVKKFIDVGAGVIDADYRGDVGVVLFNFSEDDFNVNVADRVAQLVLEKISMAPVVQVDSLDDTQRGAAGFGSTGSSS